MSLLLLLNPKFFRASDLEPSLKEHEGGAKKRKRKRVGFELGAKMAPVIPLSAAPVIDALPGPRIEPNESDEDDIFVLFFFDL